MREQPPPITPLEFEPPDFARAERMARALGYQQTAYTSSSALWGLFCLPENPATAKPGEATRRGCIIKTAQFGLLFVQDEEDAGIDGAQPAQDRCEPCLGMGYKGRYRNTSKGRKWKIESCRSCGGRGVR